MKFSQTLFLAAAVLAGTAQASQIDKERLCTEVCWTYDIGNHDGCTARCTSAQRPTASEAGECAECIDNCSAKYLDKNPNLVVYAECRKGCFSKYFPQFMRGLNVVLPRAVKMPPVKAAPKEILPALPGVPTYMRETMKGQTYPVDHEVCEMSCRAQGADNIIKPSGMKSCMKQCIEYPTDRDQELQMTLDCGSKCDTPGPDSDEDMKECLTTCVAETAPTRSIEKSLEELERSTEEKTNSSSSEEIAHKVDFGFAIPSNSSSAVASKAAQKSAETTGTSSSSDSSSSDSKASDSSSSSKSNLSTSGGKIPNVVDSMAATSEPVEGGAMTFGYMQPSSFWGQITGTLVIAMVVGVQMF